MSDTTPDTDHAAAVYHACNQIQGAPWDDPVPPDVIHNELDNIFDHTKALEAERVALVADRNYHRDDAAMVRRERDAEVKRLVAKLAEAEVENEGFRRKMAHVNVMGVMVPKRVADALAEAEARAARWKRLATTIFDTTKEQAWVDERAAAIADLQSQGDLTDPDTATVASI